MAKPIFGQLKIKLIINEHHFQLVDAAPSTSPPVCRGADPRTELTLRA